jgi:hypothetical protein
MAVVPPCGDPSPTPQREGGLWLLEMPDRVPARLSPNFGAFSQCAWLWSPTAFASLFGSEYQFCSVEPLVWVVAVEGCKDSDLSMVQCLL